MEEGEEEEGSGGGYLTRNWKSSGGLSRREIPLLHKNTGAQDLVHFAVGWTSVVLDSRNKTKQKKRRRRRNTLSCIPKLHAIQKLIGSALFPPECNKYKHLSLLKAELIPPPSHNPLCQHSAIKWKQLRCPRVRVLQNTVLKWPRKTEALLCTHTKKLK